jgi:guanine deaminase
MGGSRTAAIIPKSGRNILGRLREICGAGSFRPVSSTHTCIFPQIRVLGALGRELLDWLEFAALPEEARMEDMAYACDTARRFVRALAGHGTTTALVFGSRFRAATGALFRAAERIGLRVVSGLVMSDRRLRPELHQVPAERIETAFN